MPLLHFYHEIEEEDLAPVLYLAEDFIEAFVREGHLCIYFRPKPLRWWRRVQMVLVPLVPLLVAGFSGC